MISREMTAIIAERNAGAAKLLEPSDRDSLVEISRFREDEVLLNIYPLTDLAALNWQRLLY